MIVDGLIKLTKSTFNEIIIIILIIITIMMITMMMIIIAKHIKSICCTNGFDSIFLLSGKDYLRLTYFQNIRESKIPCKLVTMF